MGELEAASAALGVACSMPPAWEIIFVTDMPLGLVKDILQSLEEVNAGDVSDYVFG